MRERQASGTDQRVGIRRAPRRLGFQSTRVDSIKKDTGWGREASPAPNRRGLADADRLCGIATPSIPQLPADDLELAVDGLCECDWVERGLELPQPLARLC